MPIHSLGCSQVGAGSVAVGGRDVDVAGGGVDELKIEDVIEVDGVENIGARVADTGWAVILAASVVAEAGAFANGTPPSIYESIRLPIMITPENSAAEIPSAACWMSLMPPSLHDYSLVENWKQIKVLQGKG